MLFGITGLLSAQTPVTIPFCAGSGAASLSTFLSGNLNGCGSNPSFTIDNSSVAGVPDGPATQINPTSGGSFEVVVENGNNTCANLLVTLNYISLNPAFTLQNQSGCFQGTLDATQNTGPGINFSFTIDGTPLPNADVNGTLTYNFGNGGPHLVELTVTSGSCTFTSSQTITINGAVSGATTSADLVDGVYTLCNDAGNSNYSLDISNASSTTGTNTNYQITLTNDISGAVVQTFTGAGFPAPLNFSWTGTGYHTLAVTTTGGGCSAVESYSVFAGYNEQPGVSLSLPAGNLCEGADLNLNVSPQDLANNPFGTDYTLEFANDPGFTDIIFQWNGVHPAPAQILVPDLPTSCGNVGNLIYVRWISSNPCSDRIITSNVVVLHTPDAVFTAPTQLCLGQTLTGTPEYVETGQACNIPTEQWTLTNSSNVIVNQSGTNVHSYSYSGIAAPGIYTLTYTAQNFCGSASSAEVICVENTNAPSVNWNLPAGNPLIICTPAPVNPVLTLPVLFCDTPTYTWQVLNGSNQAAAASSFTIQNPNSLNPQISLITKGQYIIRVTVVADCVNGTGSWSASTPLITVAGAPIVGLTAITACAGTQVCPFGSLTVNDCFAPITAFTATWDGNPVTAAYCETPLNPDVIEACYSATNQCGSATTCEDVTITAGNSCSITPVAAVCAGAGVTLTTGQVGCTWEILSGGNWISIGANPFPYILNQTTTFRSSCSAGGCPCTTPQYTVNVITTPAFTTQVLNPLCAGSAVTVNALPTNGGVFNSFVWTSNGVPQPNGNSVTVTLNGPTAIAVYGTFGGTCQTATQTINLNPVANPLAAIACPGILCENGSCVTLPFVPGAALSLDGTLYAYIDFCPTAFGEGTYELSYELTSSGCDFSQICDITVIAQPICAIAPVPQQCPGVAFTPALQPNGLTNCSWEKSINNGTTWIPVVFPDFPNVTTIYRSDDCSIGGCGCGPLEVTVPVFAQPVFTVSASDLIPCPNTSVNIEVIQTSGTPITSYVWSGTGVTGNGTTATANVLTSNVTASVNMSFGNSCSIAPQQISITPWVSPLVVNCLLNQLCVDLNATPVATANVAVAWTLNGNAIPNATIDPALLAPGNYTLVATHTDALQGCVDAETCTFTVIDQIPGDIVLSENEFCVGENVQVMSYTAGGSLAVTNGTYVGNTISFTGVAPAQIDITVDGPCISAYTTAVEVHPVPLAVLGNLGAVCFNECLDIIPQQLSGFISSDWTWNGNMLDTPTVCPNQFAGVAEGDVITICLNAENEFGCIAQDCSALNVSPLPQFNPLPDPLCADELLVLPACGNCTDYSVALVPGNGTALNFPGSYPTPAPGDYDWTITGTLNACADELIGELHVISLVTLDILEQNITYNECQPIYPVDALITGENFTSTWSDVSINPTQQALGNNTYQYTINHGEAIQLNTSYTDMLTVSNACNSVSESITTVHVAPPAFSVDNDSLFCSGSILTFDIDVPFPISMDDFTISSNWSGYATTTFPGFPPDEVSVAVSTGNAPDTLTFYFTATNQCGALTITSSSIIVYPSDLVMDVSLAYNTPLCPGDTVQVNLVELFGNTSALSFNELLGDPLTLVEQAENTWWFVVNDVPFGAYPLEFTMQSPECPPVVDLENLDLGPGFDVSYVYSPVCPNEELVLLNESNPLDGIYTWVFEPNTMNADTVQQYNASHLYESEGLYPVQLLGEHPLLCPLDTLLIVEMYSNQFLTGIITSPNPIPSAQPEANVIALTNGDLIDSFEWYVGALGAISSAESPEFNFVAEGVWSYLVCLNAMSVNGCLDTICRYVNVDPDLVIYVPNAFTPDDDGLNDVFLPIVRGVRSEGFEFLIFDRWGDVVFRTDQIGIPWVGNHRSGNYFVPNDVYVWLLKAQGIEEGQEIKREGTVTIVR